MRIYFKGDLWGGPSIRSIIALIGTSPRLGEVVFCVLTHFPRKIGLDLVE